MKNKNTLIGFATAIAFVGAPLHAADISISADITTPTTWTADNNYILSSAIYVKNNTTLTIMPGTKILGVGDNKGSASTTDDEYGSLVVTRGAKLMAEGTAANPIIWDAYSSVYGFADSGRNAGPSGTRTGTAASRGFPSIQNTNSNGTGTALEPNSGATPATVGSPLKSGGLWGGLILLGKAPINYYTVVGSSGSQQFEKSIEGFPSTNSDDLKYGAVNAASWVSNDNSGVLRYMSLRFGGYEFATGSEINGLTMGGVGSGTTIEHIEVVSNNDDGYEFFGGTVNTKYLVSAFNKDDSFDIDEGHQGVHQFWFVIQNNTLTATFGDNGLELDGGFTTAVSSTDQTNSFTPYTTPHIYNMTVIGKGINEAANSGARLRDQFRGQIHNSLFTEFGTSIRAETTLDGTTVPIINNTVVGNMVTTGSGVYNVSTSGAPATSTSIMTTPAATNTTTSVTTLLRGISRAPYGGLDPRPLPGSLAFTHTRTTPASPINTIVSTETFDGAFGNTLWIDGWTFLDSKGYLPTDAPFADADSDGISDTVEAANTALGFNAAVSDATTVLGTLKTTAQFTANYTAGEDNVKNNPNTYSLYNSADILDLRTTGQTTVQKVGNTATLSVPVQKSTGLSTWAPAGNMTLGVDVSSSPTKEFYRLSVEGAQ